MGTYTDLSVAGYTILSTKSAVVPEAMTVFRETDRREYKRRSTGEETIDVGPTAIASPEDTEDVEDVIEYACAVRVAIDRLDVMGFTLARARREFEQGRLSELQRYRAWREDGDVPSDWADEIQFFESLTFDSYLLEFSIVLAERIYSWSATDEQREAWSPLRLYIIDGTDEFLFGFLAEDVRCLIRAACEVAPAGEWVVQDISGLVSGGYYPSDSGVCADAIQKLVAGHPENSTQIILTEGSTDASILRRALDLLFPHLSGYYAFLDFESSKSPGGAGHLVSLVKAFAATGITNRVIALFDNDTAAKDALRALAQISLPPNIVVRQYPDLSILRSYPTLGPSGEIDLNVNGLAASIELYLGIDVLKQPSGSLMPVQWKGYNEFLGRYQGEVMRKSQIHEAFDRKVKASQDDPAALALGDWSGIAEILKVVFTAFNDNE